MEIMLRRKAEYTDNKENKEFMIPHSEFRNWL